MASASCSYSLSSEESKVRYMQKLHAVGMEVCPFAMDECAWLNNPREWPSVQYADIYNYLIESPSMYTWVSPAWWPSSPPALMAVVFNRKVTKVFTSSVLNCMIGNVWVKLVTKLYHSCVA